MGAEQDADDADGVDLRDFFENDLGDLHDWRGRWGGSLVELTGPVLIAGSFRARRGKLRRSGTPKVPDKSTTSIGLGGNYSGRSTSLQANEEVIECPGSFAHFILRGARKRGVVFQQPQSGGPAGCWRQPARPNAALSTPVQASWAGRRKLILYRIAPSSLVAYRLVGRPAGFKATRTNRILNSNGVRRSSGPGGPAPSCLQKVCDRYDGNHNGRQRFNQRPRGTLDTADTQQIATQASQS